MSQFWKPGTEKPRIVDDEEGGVLFFSAAASSSSSSGFGYGSMEKQRQRLPVYKYRTAILYLVETHATTIIVGETGSGKTTQIPQYLKEAGWADGGRLIACTQPRRLAVQAVAARVAEEMGVKPGEEVGYTIRFEDLTNTFLVMNAENFPVLAAQGTTMIKFLTDGVLLREMMDDPLLTKYSVIMVDEAHERSISTDILLGLLKKIQRRRPELRLIISSATIEAKSMSAFFQTSKRRRGLESEELGPRMEPAILSVEGRGFNVQVHFVEEPISDYVQAAVSTVLSIHDREPMGDILVFLTGQDDIDTAVHLLNEEAQSNGKKSSGLFVLPLYSGLPRAEQELIFSPTPRGKRKVVISTNIAETSLTLEGIVYVVDSGFSKQRFYNPISDIENLVVAPISKASARQRAGRAGRVRPGKCYSHGNLVFCGQLSSRVAWAQVIVDLWLFEGSFGDFGSICGWSNGWINCSRVCGLLLSAMPWGRSASKLWWCMEFGWHCSVVVMMGLIICGIQLAMHGHGGDEAKDVGGHRCDTEGSAVGGWPLLPLLPFTGGGGDGATELPLAQSQDMV
ncbi:putative pre-mrna-splicing factor atp-dependent rna helicase deah9 [Fagus crenata]